LRVDDGGHACCPILLTKSRTSRGLTTTSGALPDGIECVVLLVFPTVSRTPRRTAVCNPERADVSRSAAIRMTAHKTEGVYRL
jgi:hypothetical protein